MNVENINEILVKMFKIKNTELISKLYTIALSFSRPLSRNQEQITEEQKAKSYIGEFWSSYF